MKAFIIGLGGMSALVIGLVVLLFLRHALNKVDAGDHWIDRPSVELEDFGTVDQAKLTVLSGPLGQPEQDMIVEPGLSILVELDGDKWLYDLGFNRGGGLDTVASNAKALGIDLSDVQAMFLSHRHRDHMGGVDAEREGRLDLSFLDKGSQRVTIFSPPQALDMPQWSITEIYRPAVIGEGVGSLGPIRRALFMGSVDEQALILDVTGYGLVAIVGCGHQTVPKLAQRISEVFGRQPQAIVGDLHFPVPQGRLQVLGIDAQRRLASGSGPFGPISETEVTDFVSWVEDNKIDLYLVGHDTHDHVLNLPIVQPLRVGDSVVLEASNSAPE